MVAKCWAKRLGGCGIQSREHYISQGLWAGDTVTVRGLWDEEKTVGVRALTAKNLCKTHNEGLSQTDSAAKHVFTTIEELYRLHNVRLKLKPQKLWTVKRYQVSGSLFERWAAKFLVGFFYVVGKDQKWHDSRSGPLDPPLNLVNGIFGKTVFTKPMGLYLAVDKGDQLDLDGGVGIEPLFHPDTHGLLGANLDFKGLRFVIWLSVTDPHTFDVPGSEGRLFGPNGSELMYHLEHGRFAINKALSQVLTFEW